MKRVISLIISIAMVASLATGLAVTGFADGASLNINGFTWNEDSPPAITIPGLDVTYAIGTKTYTITVNSDLEKKNITANGSNLVINLNGNKLTVSDTDASPIVVGNGDLTIQGGGTLEAIGDTAISCGGNIKITGTSTTVKATGGSIVIWVKSVTIENGTFTTIETSTVGATGIWAEDGDITINGGTVDVTASGNGSYGIYADGKITISGGTVSATSLIDAIYAGTDITISGGTVSATSLNDAIYAGKDITISGGAINATANDMNAHGINATGDITISGGTINAATNGIGGRGISAENVTITGGDVATTGAYMGGTGIRANNTLNISSSRVVKAKAQTAFSSGKGIAVNGITITDQNNADYFYCEDGGELIGDGNTIKSSLTDKYVYVKQNSNQDPVKEESTEESDPEVEIDLGYGPVTLKTSNKSVVLNDKSIIEKMFDTAVEDTLVFDLSTTPVKLDGLFFNNDVFNVAKEANKKIEIDNRFAYAKVSTKNDIGLNPLSLHLSDVSEIAGTCATYLQKKAMNTSKVYAQVNYSFVTNGNPTENDAKIYVPVDGPAKVFYLFNAEKIGIVPCEVKDGYCVFNRYFDGTYVVCAK